MTAVVGAFNQEKALLGAFSVIVKPMDRFTALFQAVNLAFPENSWGQAWGGLGRAEKWNRFRTLMDDSPSTGRWWSAVGATSYSVLQWSTIPGPRNIRVTKVELYAFGKA